MPRSSHCRWSLPKSQNFLRSKSSDEAEATAVGMSASLTQFTILDEEPSPLRNSFTDVQQSQSAEVGNFPEGEYGWVVVAACSYLTFWVVGLTYSWGVMQNKLIEINVASPSAIAFIGSTTVAFISAMAIVSGKIIRWIGTSKTAAIGSCLVGGGQVLSGWSYTNIGGLVFTVGICEGFGCGLCFMAISTLPAQYFRRRRGLANGFCYAGGGIGGAVLALSSSALLQRFDVAWTFRILGLICLATMVPSAFLLKERSRKSVPYIDWSLFKDIKFDLLLASGSIATFPLFVPPFFIPLYGSSLGLSPSINAAILAGFNLASAAGRIGFGFVADYIGPVNSLIIALTISGFSMLALWPVSTSLAPLICFVIIAGLGNGGFFSLMPTVVGHMVGSIRLTTAFGMIVTGWIGGYFMGSPIAAYLLEAYGGAEAGLSAYRPAMYYAGSLSIGSAGLVAAYRMLISRKWITKV